MRVKLHWNSPVILTYACLSFSVLILEHFFPSLHPLFEMSSRFTFSLLDLFCLFSHCVGHGGWDHLVGNFSFILLVGPLVEEKLGHMNLVALIGCCSVVTGIVHVVLSTNTAIRGASGVVFMLIALSSFAGSDDEIENKKKKKKRSLFDWFRRNKKAEDNRREYIVPVTMVLILVQYVGPEIVSMFSGRNDGVSHLSHLLGGAFGAAVGLTGAASTFAKKVGLDECWRRTEGKRKAVGRELQKTKESVGKMLRKGWDDE